MSALATAVKEPLPELKGMATDSLQHKAKEKKTQPERIVQELGDNYEMFPHGHYGSPRGRKEGEKNRGGL